MKYKALLFGSIGTLIESSDIQRNSFNEAFKEAGLDWYWDEQDYKILLKKSGGTKRVEDFAEKNNVKLALSTSTTINNVEAVFKSLSNQISKEDFHFIGNRSLVKYEKPNPEIYKLTLEKLNLEPDNCLAIEDTEESSKSAVSAGIKCIGFPGDYHSDDSFEMCIKKVKILDQSLFSL